MDRKLIFLSKVSILILLNHFIFDFAFGVVSVFEGRLIADGDVFGGIAYHHIGIETHPDEQGHQRDGNIEGIPLLPFHHIFRGRNHTGVAVGRVQLFILYKVGNLLRGSYGVINFKVTQLSGTNGGANELEDLNEMGTPHSF